MSQFEATHEKTFDEFFLKQPPCDFVEELKAPVHNKRHENFGKRAMKQEEINISGLYLDINFPDEKCVLETAYEDFQTFLKVYGIEGNAFKITVEKALESCFEEHTISLDKSGIKITAGDTEGIRRALVHLEDIIIKSEAPFLKPFTKTRKPFVKTRITRGFFSPTNRPPKNIDELLDDVDYYPDEYLNRLVHDGNNALWIYTRFMDLIPSEIFKTYGKNSEKRIEKLKKVVKKCARYGIKVFVFAVEPGGLSDELLKEFPELKGAMGWDRHAFCTHTELGAKYCIEATEWLFKTIPDLGGYIDITAGERVTNCAGTRDYKQCPRCGKYTRGEVLAYTADLIKEGMRRAGTDAEFISWTYGHREWDFEDIKDYVKNSPDDIMLMQNFDDYGFPVQLGKERLAMDYWLSYTGPSVMFEETAKAAKMHKKHLYAKMQVCCSHELATVPYIPAPALVYEKYKEAYKLGVEGILQCWYFGNYPSIMSKAAGELSFMQDFSKREEFLKYLAGIIYGDSNKDAVAKAWEYFSEGYSNYPVNIMFSYYGPMHDGVAWELQLIPKNKPLPRSWLLLDRPDGDRIGEALQQSHTLSETIELSEKILLNWKKGIEILPKAAVGELYTLSEALGVLFSCGCNILKFYQLREKLGYKEGNPKEILDKMRNIVIEEIKNSEKMISVCKEDTRLGYHSEAEGFKFFPEKIKYRINSLKKLLDTEFKEVEKRIEEGLSPLSYYDAEGEECYPIGRDLNSAKEEIVGNAGSFKMAYDEENIYIDICCRTDADIMFCFEDRLMHPVCECLVRDKKPYVDIDIALYKPLYGELYEKEYSKYTIDKTDGGYLVKAKRKYLNWNEEFPFKFYLKIDKELWKKEENPVYALGKHNVSAEEFGFVKAI